MSKVCCVPTCKLWSDDLEDLKKTFHLPKQSIVADCRFNNQNSQLMQPIGNTSVDICTNKPWNDQTNNFQLELDGENDTKAFTCSAVLPPAEFSSERTVSDSNNVTEMVAIKSHYKSLIYVDIDSLDTIEEVKDILQHAKAEIIRLRRKNRILQMKLYYWKKKVKTGNSLLRM